MRYEAAPAVDLRLVKPSEGTQWQMYLEHYLPYIEESWPENLEHGEGAYLISLDTTLRQRYEAGGRYFFFVVCEGRDVGIVNVYKTENTFGIPLDGSEQPVLNIAEFYVMWGARRKGIGEGCLAQLMRFASEIGVTAIVAEVDKPLDQANAFWRTQMSGPLDASGRYVYWKEVQSIEAIESRHPLTSSLRRPPWRRDDDT